ncbi:RNA chaperone Hfq [Metabacillus niabensis]|uniref:RNA chaperone Hfq n=1 Tax=Metabacillus niabensis TaxID=324854 RepID=UPI0039A353EB
MSGTSIKQSKINLQEQFLNKKLKDKGNVTLYTVNGYQLKGKIIGFDNYVLILKTEGHELLIYKHGITTIQ